MSEPTPATVPSLPDAFSRRRTIMGAVALAAAPNTVRPAPAAPRALDPLDARLIHLADAYEVLDRAVEALPSEAPEFDALVKRYSGIETEIADTPAASLAGVMAKARVCQFPTIRDFGDSPIAFSIADDLVRLQVEGGLNV